MLSKFSKRRNSNNIWGSLNNEMEIIINEIEAKNIIHMDFQNFIFR